MSNEFILILILQTTYDLTAQKDKKTKNRDTKRQKGMIDKRQKDKKAKREKEMMVTSGYGWLWNMGG